MLLNWKMPPMENDTLDDFLENLRQSDVANATCDVAGEVFSSDFFFKSYSRKNSFEKFDAWSETTLKSGASTCGETSSGDEGGPEPESIYRSSSDLGTSEGVGDSRVKESIFADGATSRNCEFSMLCDVTLLGLGSKPFGLLNTADILPFGKNHTTASVTSRGERSDNVHFNINGKDNFVGTTLDIIPLNFVSLHSDEPSTACFFPNASISSLLLLPYPLLVLSEIATFYLTWYRGAFWAGVLPSNNKLSLIMRRRIALSWVRSRKIAHPANPVSKLGNIRNVISCPDICEKNTQNATLASNPKELRPYTERNGDEENSKDCHEKKANSEAKTASGAEFAVHLLRTLANTFGERYGSGGCARLRECTAVVCVSSREVLGLAPVQIPIWRVQQFKQILLSQGSNHNAAAEVFHTLIVEENQRLAAAIGDWCRIIRADPSFCRKQSEFRQQLAGAGNLGSLDYVGSRDLG